MPRPFMRQTERLMPCSLHDQRVHETDWKDKACALHDQAVHEMGEKLMAESSIGASDIRSRLDQLTQSWDELKDMAATRLDSVCCAARTA